jgi:hypothetical protein
MSDFDKTKFTDLSMVSDTHDRRAITVCLEVVPKVSPGYPGPDAAPYGVKFERGDDATWFRATVHRVAMIVRYEQLIECVDGERVLKGVFRARLDEPVVEDRALVSWFSFDVNGNTWSDGSVVRELVRGEFDKLFIREDLALLIANDVQRHIYVKTATKMKIRVTNLRI